MKNKVGKYDYLLRNIDPELYKNAKHFAAESDCTLRDILLAGLEYELATCEFIDFGRFTRQANIIVSTDGKIIQEDVKPNPVLLASLKVARRKKQ